MQRPHLPDHLTRFFAPAWKSPEIKKVIQVLIGTEIILWSVFLTAAPLFQSETSDGPIPAYTPLGTTLGFALFGVILILFHQLVRWIHKRGIWSMMGSLEACWRDYKATLIWVGAISFLICLAPPFVDMDALAYTRPLLGWLIWSLIAVVVVTIQAGTEEIIYRGYLMQQLAVYRPQKWFWMWVPSIIFGISHYPNGFGPADSLFMVVWATALGYACADLTYRTGNIGSAIGLHTANNLYASLYVGIDDWASAGLARYVYEYQDPYGFDYRLETLLEPYSLFEMGSALTVMLIMWLAARVAIRR